MIGIHETQESRCHGVNCTIKATEVPRTSACHRLAMGLQTRMKATRIKSTASCGHTVCSSSKSLETTRRGERAKEREGRSAQRDKMCATWILRVEADHRTCKRAPIQYLARHYTLWSQEAEFHQQASQLLKQQRWTAIGSRPGTPTYIMKLIRRLCEYGFCRVHVLCNPRRPSFTVANRLCTCTNSRHCCRGTVLCNPRGPIITNRPRDCCIDSCIGTVFCDIWRLSFTNSCRGSVRRDAFGRSFLQNELDDDDDDDDAHLRSCPTKSVESGPVGCSGKALGHHGVNKTGISL